MTGFVWMVLAALVGCEEARRTNGWCAAKNVGYVASVEIRSHALYEALDAHGHDIDPAAVTCATCRRRSWASTSAPASSPST